MCAGTLEALRFAAQLRIPLSPAACVTCLAGQVQFKKQMISRCPSVLVLFAPTVGCAKDRMRAKGACEVFIDEQMSSKSTAVLCSTAAKLSTNCPYSSRVETQL